MREFECRNLGNNCSWKHIARTEELLADVVAVHLRDVHGVKDVDPVMLGKIKNLYSHPAEPADDEAAEPILKEYRCDMDSTCRWRYIAMTEELIADGAAVHARETHGVEEFTPAMIAKVKKAAHPWDLGSEKGRRAA